MSNIDYGCNPINVQNRTCIIIRLLQSKKNRKSLVRFGVYLDIFVLKNLYFLV